MKYSYPIIYDIKSIWNDLISDTGKISNIVDVSEIITFGIAYYCIIIGIILIFNKKINMTRQFFIFIFATFGIGYINSVYFIEEKIINTGIFYGVERLTNTNIAAFKYIILIPISLILTILSIYRKTRSFDRIIAASFSLFISLSTIIFHILYFHIIQATHLQSHEIYLQNGIDSYSEFCLQGNTNCFEGRDINNIDIPDEWIKNFVIQEYNNGENNQFIILKTTNNFEGPRVGYFKKFPNNTWKVIIENRKSTTFGKGMELAFWIQVASAHLIWLLGAFFISYRHKKMLYYLR